MTVCKVGGPQSHQREEGQDWTLSQGLWKLL